MNDIMVNPIRIKDLMILQYDEIINIIREDVESAKLAGVYIGELYVNRYVYESRSTDLAFLRNYIKTLNAIANVFGDIFHDEIYTLRLEDLLDNEAYLEIYNENTFHWIFDKINQTFNTYVDDMYIFDEFYIYGSEISSEVVLFLYNTFNEYLVSSLMPYVNYNILLKMNGQRTVRYYPYIYDKLFQQLEDLYLPFY